MASRLSRLPSSSLRWILGRPKATSAVVLAAAAGLLILRSQSAQRKKKQADAAKAKKALESAYVEKKPKAPRPAVDAKFAQRLRKLLSICIQPSEAGILAALLGLLLARTWLSTLMSDIAGNNAHHMVARNKTAFYLGITRDFGAMGVPSAFVNSAIKFFSSALTMRFRENLVRSILRSYLSSRRFYWLNSAAKLESVDHRMTKDIEDFATSASFLYVSAIKPVADIILFSRKIAMNGGLQGPAALIAYFFAAGIFLRSVQPNFAELTRRTQHHEGKFRFGHTRIIQHAEEVAFVGGQNREHGILNSVFDSLVSHLKDLYWAHARQKFADDWLIKYGATFVCYWIVGAPVFAKDSPFKNEAERTGHNFRTSHLLLNLGRALGKLVLLYKSITVLAGYTSRVSELVESLMAADQTVSITLDAKYTEATARAKAFPPTRTTSQAPVLAFDAVDIGNPDGALLLTDLSFSIKPGMNTVVAGPNASGKTSLFRAMAGLWSHASGTITTPEATSACFYVAQEPYMAIGSLRDNLTYSLPPDVAAAVSDETIMANLTAVRLDGIVARHGGIHVVKPWIDILSGGEKQLLNWARMMTAKPVFALVDECTSAVAVELEPFLFEAAQALDITLITVSLRHDLRKHHQYILRFEDVEGPRRAVLEPL